MPGYIYTFHCYDLQTHPNNCMVNYYRNAHAYQCTMYVFMHGERKQSYVRSHISDKAIYHYTSVLLVWGKKRIENE